MFAWMRPNDLIWSYWVNNYLQGRKPAAFDVLFWNADTTRMAAALHRDFVELFLANQLGHPGSATMLGTPIDLTTVKADSYIVAGIADHISRWQSCYRSVALLGGDTRFVLSTSGHVACIVNPPTNPKATFRTNEARPEDPQEWIASAHTTKGSWWPDFADWLAERNGGTVRAPSTLGSSAHTPTDKGPGTYVFEK
jgi:polyhydroxyalkanoate synthase